MNQQKKVKKQKSFARKTQKKPKRERGEKMLKVKKK